MKFEGNNQEYIEIISVDPTNCHLLKEAQKSELSLLWFKSENNRLKIDTIDYCLHTNDVVSLTEFHNVEVQTIGQVELIRWNRAFYCIVDHDVEVSCKGILYYGASNVPVIHVGTEDLTILDTVMRMFKIEMKSYDNLQHEMLRMMLKRLIILCTRMYKAQKHNHEHPPSLNIIREYNYLVEHHFKTKHTVREYAELLNKSPKTLSNLFKKYGNITPLQYIHDRIILEARRALTYTDKSISEIAFELGFSDIQVFSRFFKTKVGVSPQKFKVREKLTTH